MWRGREGKGEVEEDQREKQNSTTSDNSEIRQGDEIKDKNLMLDTMA